MSLSHVRFGQNTLTITLRGARKVFALRRQIVLDNEQIVSVELEENIKKPRWYTKVLGTNGWYFGGVFRENGENEFWDVLQTDKVFVITTKDYKFKKIYIEVDKCFVLD